MFHKVGNLLRINHGEGGAIIIGSNHGGHTHHGVNLLRGLVRENRCHLSRCSFHGHDRCLSQSRGHDHGSEVFQALTRCPTTDILFFVSTQHLHRFADHPDVRKYIELERAEDYHLAHQQVLKWYRSQIPAGVEYYLAPFSFRKGSNIYSVIFGSGHPRGMEQFLGVAWQKDKLNGEADYDLNREDFNDLAPYLPLDLFEKPKKLQVFEAALESAIRSRQMASEKDLYLFCLNNGMKPGHASPVIARLKKEHIIECDFVSPRGESLSQPRSFKVL